MFLCHAQHVRFEVASESEMRDRLRHDARLVQLSGAHFEARADAERIVLAAAEAERGQLHPHGEMRVPTVVAQDVDAVPVAEDDVLIAVAVDIRDEQRPDRVVLEGRREQLAAVGETPASIVVQQRGAVRPRHDQIEPAVVVVVEEDRTTAVGGW